MSEAVFGNVEQLFTNLVDDPDRPDTIDSGNPAMLYAALIEDVATTGRTMHSGVWTCSVGGWPETDYAVDEVMVMVEGHLRITDTDGTVHDLRAGDTFFLPRGWAGRWDVIEDMKKIFVIVE